MISFGTDEVIRLTLDIWDAMLGLHLEPKEVRSAELPGADYIGGCVQISGAWKGAVRVDCSGALARRVASTFIGVPRDTVDQEQTRDAVGELANITAGSIKPLLPRPSHISLATVVDGSDYEFTVRGGSVVLSTEFGGEDGVVVVTVLEAKPDVRFRA